MQDFITCYNPENRHERVASERFKFFSYEELMARDKASLDIFWLKDDSLDNLDDLPPPDVLQQEIIEHLEAALASFRDYAREPHKAITVMIEIAITAPDCAATRIVNFPTPQHHSNP